MRTPGYGEMLRGRTVTSTFSLSYSARREGVFDLKREEGRRKRGSGDVVLAIWTTEGTHSLSGTLRETWTASFVFSRLIETTESSSRGARRKGVGGVVA